MPVQLLRVFFHGKKMWKSCGLYAECSSTSHCKVWSWFWTPWALWVRLLLCGIGSNRHQRVYPDSLFSFWFTIFKVFTSKFALILSLSWFEFQKQGIPYWKKHSWGHIPGRCLWLGIPLVGLPSGFLVPSEWWCLITHGNLLQKCITLE
jgi:hypothetical protein